ncbi:ankyrin-1-like [Condylostylus longicornis]|uniref:ankyrin-1-like n=1 Tax=Condylostylus longicornis TaxID=2530218 RepID=UPI00244DF863|nr:ankyrin-1-like [Condylostylus longicornis]
MDSKIDTEDSKANDLTNVMTRNEIPLNSLFPYKEDLALCEKYITSKILVHLMENVDILCIGETSKSSNDTIVDELYLKFEKNHEMLAEEYYSLITKITELSTQEGNFAIVEFFLSHLTDEMRSRCINELQIDEHETSILHYVTTYNDIKMASYLTENNVNIDCRDVWGRSPIYIALKKGNDDIAKFLRESCISKYELLPRAFIDTNMKVEIPKVKFSKEGPWLINRVLKEFCSEEEVRKINNARDFNVISCFLLASRYGNSELLQFLLNQENDFQRNEFIEAQEKALLIATIYGHFNIVEILLQDVKLDSIRDKFGNTVLCVATEFGHSHIIRLLLRHGKFDINAQNNSLENSLHIAAKYGHFDIVEYLVNAKAEINLQNNNGDSALMLAIREGYTNIVKYLIGKGASICLLNKFKENAIFIATEYGHPEIVALLLQMTPELNRSNIFDETPLLVALLHGTENRRLIIKRNSDLDVNKLEKFSAEDIKIYYGKFLYGFCCSNNVNYEGSLRRIIKTENHPFLNRNSNNYKRIVELLVDHHADIHKTKLRIAFFAAAKGGHLMALKMFLGQDVHIDLDKPGESALLVAVKDGRLDVTKMLLEAGIPPNNSNENPLSLAIKYDHKSIVKTLLAYGADIKMEDSNGETPLFEACRQGAFNYVFKFRQNGANLNLQNKNGETPLYLAAFHGHFKIVKLLLDKHVDVNKKTWTGENALHVAAFRGYYDIAKILLKRGSQIINQNKKSNFFLLLEVLFNGYYDVAKLLINYGADVNIQDYFGVTPLLIAAKFGLCEITKLLLKQKVNVDETNFNNETPLIMAAGSGHFDIVKLLVEKKAALSEKTRSEETALFVACKNGFLPIVEYLTLKCLNDINLPNVDSFTPIFIATEKGHFEIVKFLFAKNASILPNNYEETPLFIAARHGYAEIVKFFLEKGSKVDSANYEGKTPLFVASENGHLKIVKILLENGANVDTVTILKETALFVAVKNQYEDIMKLLLENYADIEIANNCGETPLSLGQTLGYDLKAMWCQH